MAKRFEGVSTKLYVGNLPETCTKTDLLSTFERFGKVTECDIVKNYAFVHYGEPEDAKAAADSLDNSEFEGSTITVQLSRSKVRQKAGMGGETGCYRCGKEGHWSKDCPKFPPRGGGRGGSRGRGGGYRDDYEYGRGGGGGYDDYSYGRGGGYDEEPYYDSYRRPAYPAPRERFPDRYDPYARRRPAPPRAPPADPYYDRDPYARPPPDYYRRSPPRDPYYDAYKRDPYATAGAR